MSDNTKIEWADATVNAVNGCSVLSPGCTNCYAMKLAGTRLRHHPSRAGLTDQTKAGPVWNGTVRLNETALLEPLRWKRPRRIFWNAHGDLFHESVPDEWIDQVIAVCALTSRHQHMILTKRSARMARYVTALVSGERSMWDEGRRIAPGSASIANLVDELGWGRFSQAPRKPLPNVWLGVSVEDQARADERIPDLLATPAAIRFISAEPLLGPVDLTYIEGFDSLRSRSPDFPCIDWVIAGGESGPNARPMHPDWARSLRDQCQAAGVAFHFKQWGEWAPGENWEGPVSRTQTGATWFNDRWSFEDISADFELHCDDEPDVWRFGKAKAGRLLDGVEHSAFPS